MRHRCLAVAFWCVALASTQMARGADPAVDYQREIRPILSDKCFTCHGPDEAQRKAGLRLDSFAEATAEAKSGSRAIVPHDPDESELLYRASVDDDTLRMPPASSKKTLSEHEIELLERWIKQGAAYEGHWAFTPPVRPTAPEVRNTQWIRNPIDLFVLSRLGRRGVQPRPAVQ
jgi:hypothetical protein